MARYYTIRRGSDSYVIAWEDDADASAPKFCVTYPQYEIYASRVVERLNSDPADMRALATLGSFMKTPFALALQPAVLHG
jgi:hypothetical protein